MSNIWFHLLAMSTACLWVWVGMVNRWQSDESPVGDWIQRVTLFSVTVVATRSPFFI